MPLSRDAAGAAFAAIFDGLVDSTDLTDFLTTLASRGETAVEVAAAARALRERAITIEAPPDAIDVCGTGGDGAATYNVSTAVAIVVAACGVPVAKHGNRAASSRSGASDVLAALGIPLNPPLAVVEHGLATLGIGFLHAARHHPALAKVAAVRQAIGRRTIFNLLGPLGNPARVTRQLVGVYDPGWLQPMAAVLHDLGSSAAMVVHGDDGLDELTVTGPSSVARLAHGTIGVFRIAPADVGLTTYPPAALTGGDPAHNAAALLAVLDGTPGAYRDIVLLNAAAALIVANGGDDWRTAAERATAAIDGGAARALLARWRELA